MWVVLAISGYEEDSEKNRHFSVTLVRSLSGMRVPNDKDKGVREQGWTHVHRTFRSRQKELFELGVERGFQVEFRVLSRS